MMRSLLYKELSVLPRMILIFPPFLWVLSVWSSGDHTSVNLPAALLMGSYTSILVDFRRRNKAILIMSLPVRRWEVVLSRYIAAIIMGSALMGAIVLLNRGIEICFGHSYNLPIYDIFIGLAVPVILAIPIYSFPGIGLWSAGLTYAVLMAIFLVVLSGMSKEYSPLIMGMVLSGLLLISWGISNGIYKKMEF
jgi:hypothetical protein